MTILELNATELADFNNVITWVYVISGFLGLILFIKIWRMTDDMRDIVNQIKNIREILDNSPHYQYGHDTSYEAFQKDIQEIEELMSCAQTQEARYRLKKLIYNFNKEKDSQSDYERNYNAQLQLKEEIISRLLEELK